MERVHKSQLKALPGQCFFCGNGNVEFLIDTKKNQPQHGAVYVCDPCAAELAKLLAGPPLTLDPMLQAAIKDIQGGTDKLLGVMDDFTNDYLRYVAAIAGGYDTYVQQVNAANERNARLSAPSVEAGTEEPNLGSSSGTQSRVRRSTRSSDSSSVNSTGDDQGTPGNSDEDSTASHTGGSVDLEVGSI